MEAVDRKFKILAVCTEHGHVYTEANSVVFCAKDATLPAVLRFARDQCQRMGADARQLTGYQLQPAGPPPLPASIRGLDPEFTTTPVDYQPPAP